MALQIVNKTVPVGLPIEVKETTLERLKEYQDKCAELLRRSARRVRHQSAHAFRQRQDEGVASGKSSRGPAARRLEQGRGPAHRRHERGSDRGADPRTNGERLPASAAARRLGVHEPSGWIDFLVRWGLVVVGVCLLVGLFTRTACVGAPCCCCRSTWPCRRCRACRRRCASGLSVHQQEPRGNAGPPDSGYDGERALGWTG